MSLPLEPEHQKILDKKGEAIRTLVNRSHYILNQVGSADEMDDTAFLPVYLTFQNVFKHAEAIAALIENSVFDPAKISLRTMFESFLNLRLMFISNTKKRSLAFWFIQLKNKIQLNKRYHTDYERFKQFRADLDKDLYLNDYSNPFSVEEVEKILSSQQNLFESELFDEVRAEYRELKSKLKDDVTIRWYMLFQDEPNKWRNLKMTARQLGFAGWYEIFYRRWSESAHGDDILWNSFDSNEEEIKLRRYGHPFEAGTISQHTENLLIMSNRIMLQAFPSVGIEEFSNWFVEYYKPTYKEWIEQKFEPTEESIS